jgi:hypothetical protein
MTSDWRELAGTLNVVDNVITVQLDRARSHEVYVVEHHDGWELSGIAADAASLDHVGLTPTALWERNRYQDLIGYLVDEHGDAWVTAWLPFAGTTSEEFAVVAHEVAVEADRLEFYCTGEDAF